MNIDIALIRGDGIGPEISEATLEVLRALEQKFRLQLNIIEVEAGDRCLAKNGRALPEETVEIIRKSDVCLKAPVGKSAAEVIVKLRQMLNLYGNVRPTISMPYVNCLRDDIDFVIVRENTEGLYKGYEFDVEDGAAAIRVITKKASSRIAEYAFRMAESRNKMKKVIAVHKANVMKKTCGVFLRSCYDVAKKYSGVEFSDMLVDAAAMNLIRQPQTFDVILTTNMFGDILSDEAAQLTGGLGLAASGNIGDEMAIFEPVHGSAPDIVGKEKSNPLSMILSAKMMFEWLATRGSQVSEVSRSINESVKHVLASGKTTPDLGGSLSTEEMGKEIARQIFS